MASSELDIFIYEIGWHNYQKRKSLNFGHSQKFRGYWITNVEKAKVFQLPPGNVYWKLKNRVNLIHMPQTCVSIRWFFFSKAKYDLTHHLVSYEHHFPLLCQSLKTEFLLSWMKWYLKIFKKSLLHSPKSNTYLKQIKKPTKINREIINFPPPYPLRSHFAEMVDPDNSVCLLSQLLANSHTHIIHSAQWHILDITPEYSTQLNLFFLLTT